MLSSSAIFLYQRCTPKGHCMIHPKDEICFSKSSRKFSFSKTNLNTKDKIMLDSNLFNKSRNLQSIYLFVILLLSINRNKIYT